MNDEVSSIGSFDTSMDIDEKQDTRKPTKIIKIDNKPHDDYKENYKINMQDNRDYGVDFIANPKKLNILTTNNTPDQNILSDNDSSKDKVSIKEISYKDHSIVSSDDNDDKSSYKSDRLSYDEMVKEKQAFLVKLARLERKGYNPSKKYTMNDSHKELKTITESLEYEKGRDDSIKLQRKGLMTVVSILEYLNTSYNPFDLHLDGWTESVFENLDDYDDVFEELYEKYQMNISISPEVKLIGMIGGSAMMFHFTKALFSKTSNDVPNFNDVMNNNPELKRQYVEAASKEYGSNRRRGTGGGSGGGTGGAGGAGGASGGLFGNIFNMFGGSNDGGGGGGGIGDLFSGLMGGPSVPSGPSGRGGPSGPSGPSGRGGPSGPSGFEAPDDVAELLNGFTDENTSTLDISNDDNYSDLSSTDMEQLQSIRPIK